MGKNKKTLIILLLIIIFGSFFRLYRLDKFPPSLFGDEVDVGYQAYSILKTGKDYLGQPWPVSFHSISDWRTPLLLYAAVPFVAIFGLNEWGVRLPPAFFGIITLPLFFLLVRKLFKNDGLGLLATFFLSISMWHLQYSRTAFEVTQMLFLLVAGVYFFLKGLEKWPYLVLAAVFLALTPYSYNTAKFFLPFFGLALLLIFKRDLLKVSRKKLTLVIVILALVSLPMVYDIFFGKAGDRFSVLSIFTDPTTVPQIGFSRQVDVGLSMTEAISNMVPSFSSRIFHNKFLFWGLRFLGNYFKSFSTDFLFTFGDINYRHSIQGGFGEFYWLDAIFLLLGIYYLCQQKDRQKTLLVFGWLLLAPIPSALTRDGGNHATRLILMLPPLLILVSYGFYNFLNLFSKSKLKNLVPLILNTLYLILLMLYLHRYYVHYPLESEDWWNFGFKQSLEYVKENENNYDYIIISDVDQPPLIYSLFWLKIDPKIVQNNKLKWTVINDSLSADHLTGTKYYFGHVSEDRIKNYAPGESIKPNYLYVMPLRETNLDYRDHDVPKPLKLLKTVYFPSGKVAKYVLKGEQSAEK